MQIDLQTTTKEAAIHERIAPPMWSEAAAYCDRHGIPADGFEQARMALCHREFMRRNEPLVKMLVKMAALDLPGSTKTPGRLRAEDLIEEIQRRNAEELGLDFTLATPLKAS